MRKLTRSLCVLLVLFWTGILSAILVTVRYLLSTPQPLESLLPGKAHLYTWTHGHVYYHICGENNAPPLLLLHTPELAASSSGVRTLANGLSQHYCVYALDLPGFGQSDHPAIAYSADMYVHLYRDFLTQVLARPTTVAACGLSCNYSVALANLEPTLCERLILLSPVSLFMQTDRPALLAHLLHDPLVGLVVYAVMTRRPILRSVLAWQHGYGASCISSAALDYAAAVAHQPGAHHAPLAWLAGDLELNVSTQLEQVAQPVLVFWGTRGLHDKFGPAGQSGLPAQTQVVLVDDAGISLQEERPEKVIATILSWHSEPAAAREKIAASAQALPTAAKVQQAKTSEASGVGTAEPQAEAAIASVEEKAAASEGQPEPEEERAHVEAYCVKCKQKRPMFNPTAIVTKNGRHALEDTCHVCGSKLFRFVAGS